MLVAFENTVEFEAEMVKGLGNIFFRRRRPFPHQTHRPRENHSPNPQLRRFRGTDHLPDALQQRIKPPGPYHLPIIKSAGAAVLHCCITVPAFALAFSSFSPSTFGLTPLTRLLQLNSLSFVSSGFVSSASFLQFRFLSSPSVFLKIPPQWKPV